MRRTVKAASPKPTLSTKQVLRKVRKRRLSKVALNLVSAESITTWLI